MQGDASGLCIAAKGRYPRLSETDRQVGSAPGHHHPTFQVHGPFFISSHLSQHSNTVKISDFSKDRAGPPVLLIGAAGPQRRGHRLRCRCRGPRDSIVPVLDVIGACQTGKRAGLEGQSFPTGRHQALRLKCLPIDLWAGLRVGHECRTP